jgi:hypothetical protein
VKSTYTAELMAKLTDFFEEAIAEAGEAFTGVVLLGHQLKSPRAREYLHNGVGRRMGLVQRCVERMFQIFPPDRSVHFQRKELEDINIYLHAFLLNIYGILDDVAWVVVLEATQQEVRDRRKVSLYAPEVQRHLPKQTVDFLATMKSWHDNYIKNFRDSLAHRIPAYVPPKQLVGNEVQRSEELEREIFEAITKHQFDRVEALQEEERKLGSLMPVYTHSFGDSDRSAPVYLHNQILVDLRTVAAIVRAVLLAGGNPRVFTAT